MSESIPSVSTQFSPDLIAKYRRIKEAVAVLFSEHVITQNEQHSLLSRIRNFIFSDVGDFKTAKSGTVKCPACNAEQEYIGVLPEWYCPCSPDLKRSALDCRA